MACRMYKYNVYVHASSNKRGVGLVLKFYEFILSFFHSLWNIVIAISSDLKVRRSSVLLRNVSYEINKFN